MNNLELELFENVFSCKNLSEAAVRVSLSQPRASQLLNRLEQEMGCKLFNRSHAGAEPTNAARAFRPYAERMLAARSEGIAAATLACDGVHGSLHVGVSHTTTVFMVPLIMRQFHRAHPHVKLTLTKSMPPQLLAGIETGLLDLCLCFKPSRTAPFIWQSLFRTDMVGIFAPKFEAEVSKNLPEFARLPMVLPSRHCTSRLILDAELHMLGVTPSVVMEIDDATSLISMVKHGTAVSIVPRTMVRASAQLLVTELTHPQVFAEAGMILKRGLTEAAKAFAALVHQEVERRRLEPRAGNGLPNAQRRQEADD